MKGYKPDLICKKAKKDYETSSKLKLFEFGEIQELKTCECKDKCLLENKKQE